MKPQALGAFYKSFYDHTLDGLAYCQMIFDAQEHPVDFIYVEVNKNFEKLTGLKDAAGKKVTELIPGINTSNPELFEVYGRVSLTGEPERFETYVEPLSRWFLVSVYSPKKKFIVAVFQNTTDLKQTEKDLENETIAVRNVLEDLQVEKENLAKEKAKDEAILSSIGDGLVATDAEGKVVLVNRLFEEMLGWKESEIKDKLFTEVVSAIDENGEPIPTTKRLISATLRGDNTTTAAIHGYKRKDGTIFPVAVVVSPIFFENKFIGAVEVFRDITKEKELDRAKSEFISIAAHQLRTPISGLSWLTEALQFTSQNLDPKQKIYVRDLSTLSKRLIELIEDWLNVSRIQLKTSLTEEKDLTEISGFIETFIKEIEPYANLKKHSMVFKNSVAEPLTIEINKKSLYNVLQNLASNAIEYSPENTIVTTNLEKTGDSVKISIANKGPVIPKEEQPHLFERFYRGESAKKTKSVGTGLGLYIVKAIVEEMGGKVGFESKEGKDTVFWFTLPLKTVIVTGQKQ